MQFRNGVNMRRHKDDLAIDLDVVRDIEKEMGGDNLLQFLFLELSERFEVAYSSLCIENLTMENVWVVFHRLLLLV